MGVETSTRRSGGLRLCSSPVSGAAVPLDIVGTWTGFAGPEAGGLAMAEGAFVDL